MFRQIPYLSANVQECILGGLKVFPCYRCSLLDALDQNCKLTLMQPVVGAWEKMVIDGMEMPKSPLGQEASQQIVRFRVRKHFQLIHRSTLTRNLCIELDLLRWQGLQVI